MKQTTTSERMNEANRANAKFSTGPVTEAGKARSSQNARVHGLCGKQLHVADEEKTRILTSLRAALESELQPRGEMELIHFEAIIHAQWNIRRCRMNEAVYLSLGPDAFLDRDTRAALKTLSIYTSRHERALHKATKELQALQIERMVRTNYGDDEDGVEPSPLIETVRVRRTLLAELRAKIAFNEASSKDTLRQVGDNPPGVPVSFRKLDLEPRTRA
jgi:hypothetical protein